MLKHSIQHVQKFIYISLHFPSINCHKCSIIPSNSLFYYFTLLYIFHFESKKHTYVAKLAKMVVYKKVGLSNLYLYYVFLLQLADDLFTIERVSRDCQDPLYSSDDIHILKMTPKVTWLLHFTQWYRWQNVSFNIIFFSLFSLEMWSSDRDLLTVVSVPSLLNTFVIVAIVALSETVSSMLKRL